MAGKISLVAIRANFEDCHSVTESRRQQDYDAIALLLLMRLLYHSKVR
jgi:hypothetical protein